MALRVRCITAPRRTAGGPRPLVKRCFATQAAERKPSVLIVGAGSSGLTLALTLQRNGIKADVVEQMPQDREPWGPLLAEGTYLPVSAMAIFTKLGVNSYIERSGALLKESKIISDKGGVFGTVNLTALAKSYGAPAYGIHYRQLLRELSNAFISIGGKIAYNTSFTKLKQNTANRTVTCTFSGSRPTATYDLVVGADGAVSKVRELSFGQEFRIRKRFEKWAYYHTIMTRPVNIAADQVLEYWGNGSRLTLMPTSADALSVRATFNSVYPPYAMKGGERGIEDMMEIVEPRFTAPGLDHMFKTLSNDRKGAMLVYPYEQKMSSWVNERLVLVGDSAHKLMPNHPALSCLGIEDGFVLGKLIAERPSVDKALADYQKQRFPRAFEAQSASWDMNTKAQSSNWFRRVWRATTMFATHNSSALTRLEKKFMGDKSIISHT